MIHLFLFYLSSIFLRADEIEKIPVQYHKGAHATHKLMLKSGLKGLSRAPINSAKALANTLTGHNYHSLMNNTLENEKEIYERPFCEKANEFEMNLSLSQNVGDILGKINNCVCGPWNYCPGQNCAMENVCPFDLNIFKITKNQNRPSTENQLSFRNHDPSMPYLEITGFCWGHATVTQRMNSLSLFQEQEKINYPENSAEWINEYKSIIDDIVLHNKAREIPGFKNLYEFSNDPRFKDYFKKMVSVVWAEHAMNLRALVDSSDAKLSKREGDKFFKELDLLEKHGIAPVVVRAGGISQLGESHVLLPWKKIDDNGKTKYCFNDNSKKIIENMMCTTNIQPNDPSADGYNFSYHHERDLVAQAKSLQNLCQKKFKEGVRTEMDQADDLLLDEILYAKNDVKKMEEILAKSLKKEYGDQSDEILYHVMNHMNYSVDHWKMTPKEYKFEKGGDSFVERFFLEEAEKSGKAPDLYLKNILEKRQRDVEKMIQKRKEEGDTDEYITPTFTRNLF